MCDELVRREPAGQVRCGDFVQIDSAAVEHIGVRNLAAAAPDRNLYAIVSGQVRELGFEIVAEQRGPGDAAGVGARLGKPRECARETGGGPLAAVADPAARDKRSSLRRGARDRDGHPVRNRRRALRGDWRRTGRRWNRADRRRQKCRWNSCERTLGHIAPNRQGLCAGQAPSHALITKATAPSAATLAAQIRTIQPSRDQSGRCSINGSPRPRLCRGTPNRPSRCRRG